MAIAEIILADGPHETGAGVESGGAAPPFAAACERERLVVSTFNIRYAVGSFLITGSLFRRAGLSRPRRRGALVERNLARAARAFADGRLMPPADVIALQEADRFTRRAGNRHVAAELAIKLDMFWAHARMNIPREEEPKKKQWYLDFEEHIAPDDPGETGVALLSRLPVAAAARVELPWAECAWRPRLAMHAAVRCGKQLLHVFNSHIDPHAAIEEQLAQHAAILDAAESVGASDPVILLGDFNTLTPVSRRKMRQLLEARGYATLMPSGVTTWHAGLVRLHTDWIFTRRAPVVRWGVARPLGISDHWPVWAEIDVGEPGRVTKAGGRRQTAGGRSRGQDA